MTRDELHAVAVRAVCGKPCSYPKCHCGPTAQSIHATIAVDAIIALALARARPPQTTYGPTSTGSVGDPLSDAQIAALARSGTAEGGFPLAQGGQNFQGSADASLPRFMVGR